MSVYGKHPTYKDFIKNEINTLGFIRNQSFLAHNYDLISKAETLYSGYRAIKDKHIKNKDFSFECELELTVETKKRRVFLGANVKVDFSMVSYMLAICESDGEDKNLIRKFHFDFAIPKKGESNKPVYHLQYGGEESNLLAVNEISSDGLHPKISSPRIYSMPVNLALVLDIIFCEFSSVETTKITDDPKWKQFIKMNESFILEPFFNRVKEFLGNGHSSTKLIRDFYYGG
ncbi:MAG: hypothetical protein RIM99_09790 [Cyclobacteriaceae bacterium]